MESLTDPKLKYLKLQILILMVLCLLASPAMAAKKIVNVDFVGLVKVSETFLRKRISSIEGSTYSKKAIKKDIKSLYDTGYFDDVYVEKSKEGNGLRLVFHVREKGVIKVISFRGNKKVKEKESSPFSWRRTTVH